MSSNFSGQGVSSKMLLSTSKAFVTGQCPVDRVSTTGQDRYIPLGIPCPVSVQHHIRLM